MRIKSARQTGKLNLQQNCITILNKGLFDRIFRGTEEENSVSEFKWWEVTDLIESKFSHCSIRSVLPDTFIDCKLQTLFLDGNELSTFPEAIENLHETLKYLVLAHNKLESLVIS